ncbi:TauD/TfdA family dioxygenase [Nocardia sp. NPDC005978]|uniref:TauD/TfdA family dioxygenase n=1 Tax=Nocardia sp. NPDC005978 TaxID=3156725 RepID=UPI0033A744BA
MSAGQPIDCVDLSSVTGRMAGSAYSGVAVVPAEPHVPTLMPWLREHRRLLRDVLDTTGAVLLRGLPTDLDLFAEIVHTIGGPMLPYTEASTPRSRVHGEVYTSTEYPADQRIRMHNENSYTDRWPQLLFFLCIEPAALGGHTPIADSRTVYQLIDPAIRKRFQDGVLYIRSFREGIGLSWQDTFGTDSLTEVAEYCRTHDQQLVRTDDALRTHAYRRSSLVDSRRGEDIWFNQAHLWHESALEEDVLEALIGAYSRNGLPRNVFHADGTSISASDIDSIEHAYRRCTVTIPWRRGDLLIVDNVLIAHGRTPFRGDRRVVVAMT